ncbi:MULTISPECIES: SWIM zinc finger family protein [unclassified Streptomyces]|uniref:SWIM zinc finger family protein n=1 Tax=unclassified Streptomyces TaxID=2593676 RepID=UPI001BEBF1C1|nr:MULTISPECIES: SWIM zinc finger family protein [unclassified Streptomyces]MBT2406157.1 SWIM zinc finger family protein [Streptomyces sp. ISL-21]MBT2459510.1 SWIM zinc finger family protein [Streptomyces sp. ISL-86]MBT2609215.1 SWIM zinc finger family protein [Streptomyces sp. ISL-87]
MTRSVQALAYVRPSALTSDGAGRLLGLETAGGLTPVGAEAHPQFFAGFLRSPQAAARGLLAVADVAAARYYQRTLRASLDPVVTGNGDRLRFESFSGCCGVYARLDVLQDGLDGADTGHGTTNVDVNNPLREALSRLSGDEPLHLRVGPEELAVTTLDGPVVEKKVPLPDRWLRGFAESQVISVGFDLRAELTAAEAVRFLRALPRTATTGGGGAGGRGPMWVVPAGRTLRPTTRPVPGAVCLPGPERLAALQRVLRHATGLRVYGPAAHDGAATAAAWEVTMPGMRLTLTLSPEPARGFSGEGGVLEALATDEAAGDAELVSVLLAWEPRIDTADLAEQSGLTVARVRAALARLGTAGRVGYDVADAAYFHRELPYDAGRAERHNPRLVAARALLAGGAVTLGPDTTATVASGERRYQVREAPGGVLSCTCQWWADYRGRRGPCKHALAVRMAKRAALTAPALTTGGAR